MGEHAISAHGVSAEDLKKSRLAPGEGGQVYLLPNGQCWVHIVRVLV
jgi:hypothetical protein